VANNRRTFNVLNHRDLILATPTKASAPGLTVATGSSPIMANPAVQEYFMKRMQQMKERNR
jgi:hypothetical protein